MFETRDKNDKRAWLIECDCKDRTQLIIDSQRLTSGLKTHCGCRKERKDLSKVEVPAEYIGKTKVCTQCKEEKSYKDFYFKEYIDSKGEKCYKYNPRCISCEVYNAKINSLKRIQNDREGYLEYRKERNKRPEVRASKRENTRKRREAGYFDKFFEKHPEKLKEYYNNHRQHDITTTEWNACMEFFDKSCCYCGISEIEAKEKYKQKLHKDHVDPEGYNDVRNAAPACRECNDSKWKTDMKTWYRQQPFFSENKLKKLLKWIDEGYKKVIEDKPPYRITRRRIYNDDNTYKLQHELWTVDENMKSMQEQVIKDLKSGFIITDRPEEFANEIIDLGKKKQIYSASVENGFTCQSITFNAHENTVYLTNRVYDHRESSMIGLEMSKSELKEYIELLNKVYIQMK